MNLHHPNSHMLRLSPLCLQMAPHAPVRPLSGSPQAATRARAGTLLSPQPEVAAAALRKWPSAAPLLPVFFKREGDASFVKLKAAPSTRLSRLITRMADKLHLLATPAEVALHVALDDSEEGTAVGAALDHRATLAQALAETFGPGMEAAPRWSDGGDSKRAIPPSFILKVAVKANAKAKAKTTTKPAVSVARHESGAAAAGPHSHGEWWHAPQAPRPVLEAAGLWPGLVPPATR